MGCTGVHFALTAEQAERLMETPGADDDFVMAFVEEVESAWDKEWLQETDKAWDAIHRCLTDGKLEYGETPYHYVILGDDNIHEGDDYLVSFCDPETVQRAATAIQNIDETELRRRYDLFDFENYQGEKSADDFDYTWGWFLELRAFFQRAAAAGRAVIFTTSQ